MHQNLYEPYKSNTLHLNRLSKKDNPTRQTQTLCLQHGYINKAYSACRCLLSGKFITGHRQNRLRQRLPRIGSRGLTLGGNQQARVYISKMLDNTGGSQLL